LGTASSHPPPHRARRLGPCASPPSSPASWPCCSPCCRSQRDAAAICSITWCVSGRKAREGWGAREKCVGGGKEGRREGGKEGRREGGKEGRREGGRPQSVKTCGRSAAEVLTPFELAPCFSLFPPSLYPSSPSSLLPCSTIPVLSGLRQSLLHLCLCLFLSPLSLQATPTPLPASVGYTVSDFGFPV